MLAHQRVYIESFVHITPLNVGVNNKYRLYLLYKLDFWNIKQNIIFTYKCLVLGRPKIPVEIGPKMFHIFSLISFTCSLTFYGENFSEKFTYLFQGNTFYTHKRFQILFYMNKIPFLLLRSSVFLLTFFPIFSLPLGMPIDSEIMDGF